MADYTSPHLRNGEQKAVKHVHFRKDQVVQSSMKSHEEHLTLMPLGYRQQKEEILESENAELRNENAELRNENAELRKKVEELNKHVSQLSEEVALYKEVAIYKGDREECVPKSSFNDATHKLRECLARNDEYLKKLRDINDVHRNETDSLRTEINILREELKKTEKQVTHLSSNVTSLAEANKQLKKIIDSMKTPEIVAQKTEEENKDLISADWRNIKVSLKYILGDVKLRKQFSRETGIDLAEMKLTLSILEKLNL